jgi:hypothetical protein
MSYLSKIVHALLHILDENHSSISHAFFIAKGYLHLLAISSVTYVCTSYNLVFLNTASYCFKYLNVSLDFSYLSLEYEQILAFS